MTTKAELELKLDLAEEKVDELENKLQGQEFEHKGKLRNEQNAAQNLKLKNEGLETSLNEKDKTISAAKQAITQHLKVEHSINVFEYRDPEVVEKDPTDVRFLLFLYEVL